MLPARPEHGTRAPPARTGLAASGGPDPAAPAGKRATALPSGSDGAAGVGPAFRTLAVRHQPSPDSAGESRVKTMIPILLYHSISDSPRGRFAGFTVSPAQFCDHLDRLVELGFRTVTVVS